MQRTSSDDFFQGVSLSNEAGARTGNRRASWTGLRSFAPGRYALITPAQHSERTCFAHLNLAGTVGTPKQSIPDLETPPAGSLANSPPVKRGTKLLKLLGLRRAASA